MQHKRHALRMRVHARISSIKYTRTGAFLFQYEKRESCDLRLVTVSRSASAPWNHAPRIYYNILLLLPYINIINILIYNIIHYTIIIYIIYIYIYIYTHNIWSRKVPGTRSGYGERRRHTGHEGAAPVRIDSSGLFGRLEASTPAMTDSFLRLFNGSRTCKIVDVNLQDPDQSDC